MFTSRALLFGLLMLGSTFVVDSQRSPAVTNRQQWWNELKTKNAVQSPLVSVSATADSVAPSDDQLLTQASRMSSKLVRVPAPRQQQNVQFDDQPYDSIGSESQFMRRSTVFETPDNTRNSRDKIWSYFDSKLKSRDTPSTSSSSTGTTGSLFSSFERRQNPVTSSSRSDDLFSRHFKRHSSSSSGNTEKSAVKSSVTEASTSPYSPRYGKKAAPTSDKDRVLALDFGQTRRKNPEEKERWNQLIKNIFDSSPRNEADEESGNRYGSGDYGFKSMTKTKIVEPNEIDDEGVVTEKTLRFDSNEDVLKNEPEENVPMNVATKDMTDGETDDEMSGAKAATTMSPQTANDNDNDAEDEQSADDDAGHEENAQENSDNSNDDDDNDTGARKRHVTPPTPMEQEEEDDDDEMSNTVEDEPNQYLRPPHNKSKLARPPHTTSATTPATVNLNTKTPTRRQPQSSMTSDTFGSRIHRSNVTSSKKPSFTMHFEIGNGKKKNDERKITDLKKDIMFHPVDPTTPTTTTQKPFTEVFEGVSREMMDEFDSSIESTTPFPTTTMRPFKTRKSASGKWMDSETFKLNEDRSMIMDPNEEDDADEDDLETSTINPVANKRSSRMSAQSGSAAFTTVRPTPVIQKRKLQTSQRRKAVMQNVRSVRQNTEFLADEDLDELGRLAKALPGTPGQDYPTFSSIPKTSFDCASHEWPGYYADVETQCQVFHICQNGGRRDSFLCPNGTMFNQQLFICDWWHNVQCPEVVQHYGLNQQIYDYAWESKRNTASNAKQSSSSQKMMARPRLAKRMGIAESPSTATERSVMQTTTPVPTTQFPMTTTSNVEQVWRRAQHLQQQHQQHGTKGTSRSSRFGRQAMMSSERSAIKAFFERYKYARAVTSESTTTTTTTTPTPLTTFTPTNSHNNNNNKLLALASGSQPTVLTFTTINDVNNRRHHKHHRA